MNCAECSICKELLEFEASFVKEGALFICEACFQKVKDYCKEKNIEVDVDCVDEDKKVH